MTDESGGASILPESHGQIELLQQDDDIVIIDKPAGMLVHRHQMDHHSPNVVAVLTRLLERPVYPVHRLDRMTSGAMVLALTQDAAANLSDQFRYRRTSKRYLAIVRGHMEDVGTVENPVPRNVGGAPVDAMTEFQTVSRSVVAEPVGRYDEAWFSLVDLTLHTGRAHQARRHLHQIDHPIIGDNRHGDKAYNRWAAARFGERHMYLRAMRLEFDHPVTGSRIATAVGVPDLWRRVCGELGLALP